MTIIETMKERIRDKLSAPFTHISSNVLLSREDSEYIVENGQVGADEVAARLQSEQGVEVKITTQGVYDTDIHSLNWGGPRF